MVRQMARPTNDVGLAAYLGRALFLAEDLDGASLAEHLVGGVLKADLLPLRARSPKWDSAAGLGEASGARLTVTDEIEVGVAGADFLYADVWLSMGEPAGEWDQRIE